MAKELEVLSPYDGRVVGKVVLSGSAEVEAALRGAERGLGVMRTLSAYQRSEILYRVAELVAAEKSEFARILVDEVGKTIQEARTEVARCIETLKLSAEEAKRIAGETVPLDAVPTGAQKFGFYIRVPIGVVLAITPFNFPLNLVAHKLGPAIAAGCSVVLKPATKTPLSALKLTELFYEAGLPREVLSVAIGPGEEIGDLLVKDPRPRALSFTGSRAVGSRIARNSGLKRLILELGSNSACLIFADADLNRAAQRILKGGFSLAGQVCISVQRVYIESKVVDKFLDVFLRLVESLKVGDPALEETDMGPMISSDAVTRILEWIDEAVKMGGKLLTGGTRKDNFLYPTVLFDVPESARIIQEEAFAPVVVVNRFEGLDEGILNLNSTPYGLQAGVFTKDLKIAWECAQRIECGGVLINEVPTFRVDLMPYGGMKESGMGREGPRYAIEELTEPKLIILDTGED